MKRIYVYTQGCTANQADSEIIKGLLGQAGYKIVDKIKEADLVVFNTCSLKTPTENRLFRKIQDVSENKKVIVAGCFPLSFPNDSRLKGFSLVGSFDFKRIVEAVSRTLSGERVEFLSREAEEKLCLPRIRDNKTIAKIVISKGCLGNCTYCAGKLGRGELVSYPKNKIIKEVKRAIEEGCARVYLTSQDCGCYGFDRGASLPDLMKEIFNIENISKVKIRIGMMNPQWAFKLLDNLIDVYSHPSMLKFLHIPVQSGSDKILKKMNRQYTINQFKEVVRKFRKEISNITISTDIIVGFPCETERDFQKTVELIEWLKPDVLNVTKFWPRKGTAACNMKQLPDKTKKERAKIISDLFKKQKK